MIKKIKYGNSTIRYELIKSKRKKTSQITVTAHGITLIVPYTKTSADIKNMQKKFNKHIKSNYILQNRKKQTFL